MATQQLHIVIIGAGPGGYTAALAAAQRGFSVTLIDERPNPGGVCLHCGCIPSKTLLHAAKIMTEAKAAREIGIHFFNLTADFAQIQSWKNEIVSKLARGLDSQCQKHKINFISGHASFAGPNTIKIEKNRNSFEEIKFDYAIIATGSSHQTGPFAVQSPRILNSTSALDSQEIPSRLLVIGGGYIGLELGTFYAALGSKVSVVEMTGTLLPGVDHDLVSVLQRRLKTTFEQIMLNTRITKIEETAQGIKVLCEHPDGQKESCEFDKILLAIGRQPLTQHLGLENTRVQLDERGFIKVNAQRQTTDPVIYAIGDVTGQPMLAHKASAEAPVAIKAIAGETSSFAGSVIPAVVFTDPEIAWCGLTETQTKEQKLHVKTVKMPWGASGRATTLNRTDGLTKIIIDPASQKILGMSIVGCGAGELIGEGVIAVQQGMTIDALKNCIHPHPTLSETITDTANLFSL